MPDNRSLELIRLDFRLVLSKRSIEAAGKSIGRSKGIDLFPRTDKSKNWYIFWQKHALIYSRERPRTIANSDAHSTSR